MSRPTIRLSPLVVVQAARYRVGAVVNNAVCAGCRSATSRPACVAWVPCQLCGVSFHDTCYWRGMATAVERRRWESDGELDLFVCSGCRS
jgi:hypothetical protein